VEDGCNTYVECKELSIRIEIPVSDAAKWAATAKLLLQRRHSEHCIARSKRGLI
jgi:hypothetical protein